MNSNVIHSFILLVSNVSATCETVGMDEIEDALRQAKAALLRLAQVQLSLPEEDRVLAYVTGMEQLGRLVDTGRALGAAEVFYRSRYEVGAIGLAIREGYAKPFDYIAAITRTSSAEVSRRVRLGDAIRHRQTLLGELLWPDRPVLADAMVSGEVGDGAAHTILTALRQARRGSEASPENMDAAEASLVELAKNATTDDVARLARKWRDALDPDGVEPRYEDIQAKRGVSISPEHNGIKHYRVDAGPTLSAVLDAVFLDSLDRNAGPRFMSEEDIARGTVITIDADGNLVESVNDLRTIEQKRADALEGMLVAAVRAAREGSTDTRSIGMITATISLEDLRNGTGFGQLEGTDEVVPASVVQELVCDAGFYPIVLSDQGMPLFHGTLKRSFTRAQRRAIVARDGDRCIARGCRKRAAACHAHHVVFWSQGGRTDVDNGVMLCPAHHHALHQGVFELKMVDGLPWIRDGRRGWSDDAWEPVAKRAPDIGRAA